MLYYHGSSQRIKDYLEPRPSRVINNERAIFATNTKWLAIFFIAKSNDTELSLGFANGIPHIIEMRPNMIDERLKGKDGYLYYLDAKYFQEDDRLGMPNHEFISYDRVPIEKSEYIKDIYDELVKTEVIIISFDEWMDSIGKLLEKKMKQRLNQHGSGRKLYRLISQSQ